MTKKRSILMIYTGGTIGMVKSETDGTLIPLEMNNLYHYIPILERLPVSIDMHSMEKVIDSSDMDPEFWKELAGIIENNYLQYDGFVILHGSDTMAYTASVLSFMLENLNKSVILTGSQLPLGMIRSDGRENMINAIEIASAYDDDTPIVPEVAVCFENKLLRGNRTSKVNAENFDAFLSGNYPVLAEIGVNIRFNRSAIARPSFKNLKVHKNLSGRVGILKLFPGITKEFTRNLLLQEGIDIVILETFGSGNAPSGSDFVQIISEAIKNGKTLFNVTQCKGGVVEMGKYAASKQLLDMGVVSGHDITTEAAIAKAMFLLGQGFTGQQLASKLEKPLCGEMGRGEK
ncbi:MAG: L-asparaginase 1 [Bacteroidetes bacterium HGW-Bacteroidetes-6]|jgi:L-asparaginase|nr:MAG: L-asparaginase 1 [Bacteroidetes bacterium HGW-Bacteroidetes-6]